MAKKLVEVNLEQVCEEKNSERKIAFLNDYASHLQKDKFLGENRQKALFLFKRFTGKITITNTTIENGGLLHGPAYLDGWETYMAGKSKVVEKVKKRVQKAPFLGKGYVFDNEWTENKIPNSFLKGYADADFYHFLQTVNPKNFKKLKPAGKPKSAIEDILYPLSGYWRNEKIMQDEEYKRLIEYVQYTLANGTISSQIKSIDTSPSGITLQFVKHTFYLVWKEANIQKSHPQILWVRFLKKVFPKLFKSPIDSYLKKFSVYLNNYTQDKNSITFIAYK